MPDVEQVQGITPLVGWRGFTLLRPFYIASHHHHMEVWTPLSAKRFECEQHQDGPGRNCRCGLYAFKKVSDLRTQNYNNQDLYAECALWGRVLEFEHGYRAEFAYPLRMYYCPETRKDFHYPGVLEKMATKAAYTYGCSLERIQASTHEMFANALDARVAKDLAVAAAGHEQTIQNAQHGLRHTHTLTKVTRQLSAETQAQLLKPRGRQRGVVDFDFIARMLEEQAGG